MKEKILSILIVICLTGIILFAFSVGINDCRNETGAFAKSGDVYPVTAARMASKKAGFQESETNAVIFIEPETETAEREVFDEQETSEEMDEVANEELGESATRVEILESKQSQDETLGEVADRHNGFVAYGIWTGQYWHFTPEQIDAQWRGLKTSKPILPQGTTRDWQSYLYDRLAGIGAEWFYKYAVAQAMQESGFNPLNQQGNDAVPDKGLFSFRIWYWNSAYGDVFDYHANINAYIDRIAPYLTDSSEAGIYRAISQHYQPNGQTNMTYVNQVIGRLNELWEVE